MNTSRRVNLVNYEKANFLYLLHPVYILSFIRIRTSFSTTFMVKMTCFRLFLNGFTFYRISLWDIRCPTFLEAEVHTQRIHLKRH